MTVQLTGVPDPLAPLRHTLISAAERDAAQVLATADVDAQATRRAAELEVEAVRRAAHARGEEDAREVVAVERARTRRAARTVVLAAQGEAYERLRDAARAAVLALRGDPGYPALRDRLAAQTTAAVGVGATVTETPDGGVVAEAPGRRATLTLTALADRALDDLGPDMATLWTP